MTRVDRDKSHSPAASPRVAQQTAPTGSDVRAALDPQSPARARYRSVTRGGRTPPERCPYRIRENLRPSRDSRRPLAHPRRSPQVQRAPTDPPRVTRRRRGLRAADASKPGSTPGWHGTPTDDNRPGPSPSTGARPDGSAVPSNDVAANRRDVGRVRLPHGARNRGRAEASHRALDEPTPTTSKQPLGETTHPKGGVIMLALLIALYFAALLIVLARAAHRELKGVQR